MPKSLILFIPNTRSSTSWNEEHKVKLDAEEFDIIHSEHEIEYELDSWFGILVDADTIVGVSKDGQGIEGKFTFTREKN